MLEGKCPKCNGHYYGQALSVPGHQTCPVCGIQLDITNYNHTDVEQCQQPGIEKYLQAAKKSGTVSDTIILN